MSHDLVIKYVEVLHRQRAVLAEAYHRGSVDKTDDNARAIYELQQHRALVPFTQDTYRLASSLARHLDEVLQKERMYAAVGANIGELAGRLPYLIDETEKAHLEGRQEDADAYADNFNAAVFDLADSITGALQYLRMLADNSFANVSTLAEKKRQNEYYIGRAERISDALRELQMAGMGESLEERPGCEGLAIAFRSQLADRLPQWRASLLDITDILKSYLYRLRQVEPAARRLRAFALFLKRNPDYVAPDVDEIAEPPAWALRARPLRLKARPDLSDSATSDALADLARALPLARVLVRREPKLGMLTDDGAAPPIIIPIAPKPYQVALDRFLGAVATANAPISAIAWKAAEQEFDALPGDIWLHCVLYEYAMDRRRLARFSFERVEATPDHALSGNIVVRDVLARRVE
ncbi:MAG TPA: hypothetical protein VMW15_16025 [Terracidiphilus sp.]|nr:hypothetical protein [Terracidiphilus sp.]